MAGYVVLDVNMDEIKQGDFVYDDQERTLEFMRVIGQTAGGLWKIEVVDFIGSGEVRHYFAADLGLTVLDAWNA